MRNKERLIGILVIGLLLAVGLSALYVSFFSPEPIKSIVGNWEGEKEGALVRYTNDQAPEEHTAQLDKAMRDYNNIEWSVGSTDNRLGRSEFERVGGPQEPSFMVNNGGFINHKGTSIDIPENFWGYPVALFESYLIGEKSHNIYELVENNWEFLKTITTQATLGEIIQMFRVFANGEIVGDDQLFGRFEYTGTPKKWLRFDRLAEIGDTPITFSISHKEEVSFSSVWEHGAYELAADGVNFHFTGENIGAFESFSFDTLSQINVVIDGVSHLFTKTSW